jgi:hypothetical protein
MSASHNRSRRALALFLAVVMTFGMVTTAFGSTAPAAEVPALALAQAAVRGTNYRNLSLNPGAGNAEMRFTWHSGSPTGSIRISNPNGADWVLTSENPRPVEAHQGTGGMGEAGNILPTRTGFTYWLHMVAVYDLAPDTQYTYVVVWDTGESAPKSFRTGGSSSFQFLVAGDPQIGVGLQALSVDGAGWQNTLNVATRAFPNAEFVLSVGDQIQTTNADVPRSQERHDQMFAPVQLQTLPLLAVVGNHDGVGVANSNHRLWPLHYNIPVPAEVGAIAHDGGDVPTVFRHGTTLYTQFDYWVRWGNVFFIVLDSNTRSFLTSEDANADRMAFIEAAFAANADADWKIAAIHHSPYSVYRGTTDGAKVQIINRWIPEFERLGVDAVLSGHCHVYSRSHQMLANEPLLNQ